MRLLRDRRHFKWNLLLALSGGFAGLLIVNANLLDINRLLIQVPMYFIIALAIFILVDRLEIYTRVASVNRRWQTLMIGVFSIYTIYVTLLHYWSYFAEYQHHVDINTAFVVKSLTFGVLGAFAIFTSWRFFYWGVAALYEKLDFTKLEKKLIVLYVSIGVAAAIFLSIFITNNFVLKLSIVDTIYAMDSSALMYDETYDNNVYGLGTDVRHPFAQAINTPLGIISRVIGQVFHFVPYAQAHAYQGFMLLMIAVVGVLLTRLLGVESRKLKIVTFILYTCLYSTLIFMFAFEQYVQVVLLMILMVYSIVNRWSQKWIIAFLVMAAGYTITTPALGFVLLLGKGDWRYKLKNAAIAAGAFILTAIASGKLLTLVFFDRQAGQVAKFSDGDFIDRIHQFINFLATTITVGFHTVYFDGSYHKYRTDDINMEQINLVGLLILALTIFGYIVSRKKLLTQIAVGWVIFSFVVCVVVGWGASYNEFALYSMYFGWAYFILAFEAVRFIINKTTKSLLLRERVLVAICLSVAVINVIHFSDILTFAHDNYPVQDIEKTFKEYLPYEKEK